MIVNPRGERRRSGPRRYDATRYEFIRFVARHSGYEPARNRTALDAYIEKTASTPCKSAKTNSPAARISPQTCAVPEPPCRLCVPNLTHTPKELQFGTSGRRGLIADLTQLEIYINVTAELEYLQSLAAEDGGIRARRRILLCAGSAAEFANTVRSRGAAITDAGMRAVNLGQIPTPALMYYARASNAPASWSPAATSRSTATATSSIPRAENSKSMKRPIGAKVAEVRERVTRRIPRIALR